MTAYEFECWGILHSAQLPLQNYLRHFLKNTKGIREEGTASSYSNVRPFMWITWKCSAGSQQVGPPTHREREREREREEHRYLKEKKQFTSLPG
jgi:hypothetical protein